MKSIKITNITDKLDKCPDCQTFLLPLVQISYDRPEIGKRSYCPKCFQVWEEK